MNFKRALIATTAVAGITLASGIAAAETVGVTDTEIRVGNTNPYSGPASSYGQIGETINAYVNKINAEGGINGRKIVFISYDDGYSPPKTKEQIRKLVEQDQVAFTFQTLGTPTNSAVHKYMNQKGVPHLFVATGATKWGDPENYPWTMGWQPNYQSEGVIFARHLLETNPDSKVGILFQNDDYGKDYVHGMELGLGDRAEEVIVARESYEVTDPTVDSQVIKLSSSGADVFYNVTIPKFAAQAIRKSFDIGWDNLHLLNSVSNSVGSVLKPAGLDKSEGVVSLFYLMDPTDPQWQDHEDYAAWSAFMDKYHPDGDRTSSFTVYGYALGQVLEKLIQQAGDDLSRENIMKSAASFDGFRIKMALPGITMDTSPTDFYPIEQMQLGRFENGGWVLFGDVVDGAVKSGS